MKKNGFMSFLVLLTAFLMVAPNAIAEKPVNIGVLVPLTGIVAQGGLEMKYGIEMAAEEKGTLLGRPIKLMVEDTQVKPPVA
ncbi:MAG: ABC transporter substrate-binding protein, partial [Desulfobacterales bacterium]